MYSYVVIDPSVNSGSTELYYVSSFVRIALFLTVVQWYLLKLKSYTIKKVLACKVYYHLHDLKAKDFFHFLTSNI